jgi:hypothetical protein
MTKDTVISRGEAATLLRLALGPEREWFNFLTDCARHRTSFNGLRLFPVASVMDARAWRPVYSETSVKEFIRQAQESHPELRSSHTTIKRASIEYDDSIHWARRKASLTAASRPS